MKRLSKLLLAVLLAFVCVCPFAGCKKSDWIEVQKITYTVNSGSTTTLTSRYYWDYDEEDATAEEFREHYSNDQPYLYGDIDITKSNILKNYNDFVGQTFFYRRTHSINSYFKATLKKYYIEYVKVKFSDNNTLEIDFEDKVIKILPTTFEITYFEN